MILQSKAVYVKKQWIKCQHCFYEWLSETKVTPETSKKRVCCSKCRSSITVTFSKEETYADTDTDEEKNENIKPKLVKTVQELEEVQDPHMVVLNKQIEELDRKSKKNEMEMDNAVQELLKRYPAPSPDMDALDETKAKESRAIWHEKMKRMSYAQKRTFMVEELHRIVESFKGGLSNEQMKPFEIRLAVEERYAQELTRIENEEQINAQKDDRKHFKSQSQNKSLNRNKIKIKQRKVRRSSSQ
jgi:hypothetical protein